MANFFETPASFQSRQLEQFARGAQLRAAVQPRGSSRFSSNCFVKLGGDRHRADVRIGRPLKVLNFAAARNQGWLASLTSPLRHMFRDATVEPVVGIVMLPFAIAPIAPLRAMREPVATNSRFGRASPTP